MQNKNKIELYARRCSFQFNLFLINNRKSKLNIVSNNFSNYVLDKLISH